MFFIRFLTMMLVAGGLGVASAALMTYLGAPVFIASFLVPFIVGMGVGFGMFEWVWGR